jgi:HAD superfamily hydrolase (TIGR01549 family)
VGPTAVAFDAFGTLCDLGVRRALPRRLGGDLRTLWQYALTHPTVPDATEQDELRIELASFFLYPDTLPVLARLRRQGVPVAVVSNVSSPYARLLHDAFDGHVDHLVLSCEVGVAKPDPAIFALTTERLGRAPAEILMIGDSPVSDVAGARAFGMPALRICRGLQAPGGTLTELTQLFERLATLSR